jgi:hypothetical protein
MTHNPNYKKLEKISAATKYLQDHALKTNNFALQDKVIDLAQDIFTQANVHYKFSPKMDEMTERDDKQLDKIEKTIEEMINALLANNAMQTNKALLAQALDIPLMVFHNIMHQAMLAPDNHKHYQDVLKTGLSELITIVGMIKSEASSSGKYARVNDKATETVNAGLNALVRKIVTTPKVDVESTIKLINNLIDKLPLKQIPEEGMKLATKLADSYNMQLTKAVTEEPELIVCAPLDCPQPTAIICPTPESAATLDSTNKPLLEKYKISEIKAPIYKFECPPKVEGKDTVYETKTLRFDCEFPHEALQLLALKNSKLITAETLVTESQDFSGIMNKYHLLPIGESATESTEI